MFTKTTYMGTLKGINGIWCGFKPKGIKVTEEREVLYPEEGYELKRIADGEILSAVWLQDEDVKENYEEIPVVEHEI